MIGVHKMDQLVQNNKINANSGMFQQAKVEGNRLLLWATAAPPACHAAHGDGRTENTAALQQRQHSAAGLVEESFAHFHVPLLKKSCSQSGVFRFTER